MYTVAFARNRWESVLPGFALTRAEAYGARVPANRSPRWNGRSFRWTDRATSARPGGRRTRGTRRGTSGARSAVKRDRGEAVSAEAECEEGKGVGSKQGENHQVFSRTRRRRRSNQDVQSVDVSLCFITMAHGVLDGLLRMAGGDSWMFPGLGHAGSFDPASD